MSNYIAALYAEGRVVTGFNHGDAFSKLSEAEQDGSVESGFLDPDTGRFFTEEYDLYLKKIFLIRHAQAESQHFHANLTEIGQQQAESCAKFLLSMNLKDYHCLCSPYDRCIQTAQIINLITSCPVECNPDLACQTEQENDEEFSKRIEKVLCEIPAQCILVSHCDFILRFIKEAIGEEFMEEYKNGVPNAGIMSIEARRIIRRF